ncbi:hypothetical protein [Streptococcus iniae]|nr:hypothetical protein [Streptococcus iniae]EKB51678.1 xylanase/chitin deacetylase family enzyme [Streptococcus iniae 9117]APD32202.1 chitin deacetylase [Streptococcus iniae]ELY5750067.1 chitin deacetylase [Streptococcus iniae]KYJ76094.1 chitin deacetylase [Streptococcus iniae]MCM0723939.1 chitin deacetylase [Streptococcus iniae]
MTIIVDDQTLPLVAIEGVMYPKLVFLKLLIICWTCYFIGYYINKTEKERTSMMNKGETSKETSPNTTVPHFSSKDKPHGNTVIKPKIKMQSETIIISLDEN